MATTWGDDHGRDRLTLPTLGDIDGAGLVMMTRATMPTACGDAVQLLAAIIVATMPPLLNTCGSLEPRR